MSSAPEDGKEPLRAPSAVKITLTATTFCLSGSLLTIFNKLAMTAFPAPNFVLFLQNSSTLLLLAAGAPIVPYELGALERTKVLKWLPLVLLFYLMLVSSMLALESVTATTLIVQRNLATVTIAFADFVYLGTIQTVRRVIAIACMCLGSILYVYDGLGGLQFSREGYLVAREHRFNYSIPDQGKSLVNELKLNSWTMSKYNCPVSVLSLVCFGKREFAVVENARSLRMFDVAVILTSCTLGFILSVSAFQLNRMITPTSITVLNNTNKLRSFSLHILWILIP